MARKGENIYKRKDGRWEGRYIKGHVNAKVKYGYVYAKTYKEVKNKLLLKKEEALISSNTHVSNFKFTEISHLWMQSLEPTCKYSTVIKYSNLLNTYILPYIGEMNISTITYDDIVNLDSYLLSKGRKDGCGLSSKTVTDVNSTIGCIRKYALRKKIPVNFDMQKLPTAHQRKSIRIFSIDEENRLLSYLLQNATCKNLGIVLCLFTGIRLGELCALKWDDILLSEKVIYIHATMQRIQCTNEVNKTKIIVTEPKSSCSIRCIPIPDYLFEIIKDRKVDNCYFLSNHTSKYVEPRVMQYHFKKSLKKCSIKEANFHALRHTFATRCVEVGFETKCLSEILGHSSVNITLNRYVHPSMDSKQTNMNKLSNLFAVK